MDFKADHFSLLGLPRQFRLDPGQLDQAWRDLQGAVHPDRFASAGTAEQRLAVQWATRANEAGQTLKKPLRRACYLLELAGEPINAQNNTAMPPDFLTAQMERREQLHELRAARDETGLDQLASLQLAELETAYQRLAVLMDDEKNLSAASELVRRLLFMDKLRAEIADALAELD